MPATVFKVTTTDDTAAAGTLRSAIVAANANPGADVIKFAIPRAGVKTIVLTSPLPAITDPITIDGKTQPGVHWIVLDGAGAGVPADGITLGSGSAGSTIRGLAIGNFSGNGISVQSDQNLITGNRVGTDFTGTIRRQNDRYGIYLASGVSGNQITSNLISGNLNEGIFLDGATGNKLLGNRIGLDKRGNALSNYRGVCLFNSAGNTVQGNIISGSDVNAGVFLTYGSSDNLIIGNRIGTDPTGKKARGNRIGVEIIVGSHDNFILNNLISGNGWDGVSMHWPGTTGNIVLGNRIGTSASGNAALPNGSDGVEIFSSASGNTVTSNIISANGHFGVWFHENATGNSVLHNLIGVGANLKKLPNRGVGVAMSIGAGSNSIIGNRICFNLTGGVDLADPGTSANIIQGNIIGFNAGNGVGIHYSASSNIIGGLFAGAGNSIFKNGGFGVAVDGAATLNNTIRGNSTFANGAGGINLSNGGNNNQASPTLVFAVFNGIDNTSVLGSMHAAADTTYVIELFDNQLGPAQGKTLRGTYNVTTNGNGEATFTFDLTGFSTNITATATDPSGNTSAFSNAVEVMHF